MSKYVGQTFATSSGPRRRAAGSREQRAGLCHLLNSPSRTSPGSTKLAPLPLKLKPMLKPMPKPMPTS
ncbi:GL23140 [Drosophila persimilis]|uniref:GL23140 n=1 Tax=Drosophila persimilis TaxID=7234 RepID=B4G5M4_DROPE|nr:GL23140 [Drosophila persimilis]